MEKEKALDAVEKAIDLAYKKGLEKGKLISKRRLRKEYNKGFKDGQSNESAFESSRKQLNGK